MNKKASFFMNTMFLLFSAAGSYFIFNTGNGSRHEYLFYVPAALTVLYGLITGVVLLNCSDSTQAEHWSDSIYFNGFIFTLVSLSFLFYRFYSVDMQNLPDWIISETFYYIGISVTTSVAGVLLKNMVKASWLRRNPEKDDELSRTYMMMKEMAESFSTGYEGFFSSIGQYLEERRENAKIFDKEEKALLSSFEQFREVIDRFNDDFRESAAGLDAGLKNSAEVLELQRQSLQKLIDTNSNTEAASEYFSAGMNSIPFDDVSESMDMLRRQSEELNTVLDSIIRIIDLKVQKVS